MLNIPKCLERYLAYVVNCDNITISNRKYVLTTYTCMATIHACMYVLCIYVRMHVCKVCSYVCMYDYIQGTFRTPSIVVTAPLERIDIIILLKW